MGKKRGKRGGGGGGNHQSQSTPSKVESQEERDEKEALRAQLKDRLRNMRTNRTAGQSIQAQISKDPTLKKMAANAAKNPGGGMEEQNKQLADVISNPRVDTNELEELSQFMTGPLVIKKEGRRRKSLAMPPNSSKQL